MFRTHRRTPAIASAHTATRSVAPRRRALLSALVMAGALAVLPASAAAAAPIALDAPDNGTAPQLAYDPTSQTTYVAWNDPVNPAIDLCVLPANVTTCEGGAPVSLTDTSYPGYSTTNRPTIGGIVVLPSGETVVIGAPVSTGTVAWASPAGGAAFLTGNDGLQNGGNFISPVSIYRTVGNVAALSNTDVALLDDYGDFFSDSPFAGPESPAIPSPNTNQTTSPGQFSRKSLETDGPELAAEPAPAPAPTGTELVVGVADNFSGPSQALPGCVNSAGTGYGVSAGTINGGSNGAGTLNKAGLPAYQVLACSALSPVLASGGQAGIGVVETEGNGVSGVGSTFTVDYRPFIATATGGNFGAPVLLQDVTSVSLGGVIEIDAAEDSGAGVYASWVDSQGLVVDYSSNGGATWDGPVVVPAPATGSQGNPVMAGVGGGLADFAYVNNPGTGSQVFLQQAVAVPTVVPVPAADTITTQQTAGVTQGSSITVPAGTIGEADKAIIAGANAASATGTMTFGLFSNSSCAASSAVFKSTAAVGGGVAFSTGVSSALASGTYYWQATYSGNATNLPSASTCGSEVLSVVPAASTSGGGSSNGATVTITVTCASTPCTVTITITIDPITNAARAAKTRKSKIVTIASGTFKIKKAGKNKLAVKLTKAGKKLLKTDHGHLKATELVSTTVDGHVEKIKHTIKITTVKKKK